MSIRRIVTIGDEILRRKAQRVRDFGPGLADLLDDMLDTMIAGHGVGLAAPQVAVDQQVIIVWLPDDEESVTRHGDQAGGLYEVVNPKIIRASRQMVSGIEGCLSIPGYVGAVLRHESVVVRAQDRSGAEVRFEVYNWLARVFQHEIDHLNGVLYIDRATEMWRIDESRPEAVIG